MKCFLQIMLLLAGVSLLCCDAASGISEDGTVSELVVNGSESIAIIYDYNPERSKLESKAVKVNPSTGDKLKDALKAFFATNDLYGSYDHIQLKQIDKSQYPNVFVFSGKPGFSKEEDQFFFTLALEMTIARNFESMDYKVKFVDF